MLVVEKKPKSISAEAYRKLRTNVQYSSFDKEIKIITITSTELSEGKTFTACNLALSLVDDGKKVILVDCDLRRPSIFKEFKLDNEVGLSEVLLGKKHITKVITQHKSGLHILPSGKIPPNPAEMLGSRVMTKLLDELNSIYDYIILDSPPVLAVSDSQILSAKADGTILVIRANKTKKKNVLDAKDILNKINANIIGVVFNSIDTKRNKINYYEEK